MPKRFSENLEVLKSMTSVKIPPGLKGTKATQNEEVLDLWISVRRAWLEKTTQTQASTTFNENEKINQSTEPSARRVEPRATKSRFWAGAGMTPNQGYADIRPPEFQKCH